jgi:hypothetical protein
MNKPTCTCHPVPEQYHTTHYGATEPGSTLEPDYGCAVHFPGVVEHDPDRCGCRWGEQPCDRCLPVLAARFAARIESERSGA